MNKKRFIFSIIIKSLLIIIALIGVYLSLFGHDDFMTSIIGLLYFTIQSNIWIMTITIIFLVKDIISYVTKKPWSNNTLLIIKFVFTVAITVTFLVFFIMLAPSLPVKYLTSFNNLSVHFLVPILSIIDFFWFCEKINLKKFSFLYGCIPNLLYLIFALIISTIDGITYSDGAKVPYFFMDYTKLGWFRIGNGSIGVFYWCFILCIAITLLAYLYQIIILRVKHKKESI